MRQLRQQPANNSEEHILIGAERSFYQSSTDSYSFLATFINYAEHHYRHFDADRWPGTAVASMWKFQRSLHV
jgi:hypothetical protein